jgi:hypothetical protein
VHFWLWLAKYACLNSYKELINIAVRSPPLIYLYARETPYYIFMLTARRARTARARAPPSDLRQINSIILKVPDAVLVR